MKTLKIIDFYSINNFHEIVNFSLLQCFSNIYSNVIYIVGKSAYENMQKLSTQNNIEFSNVTFKSKWVVELTHPLGALLRMLFGFFIFLKEYFMLKKGETIFYNYNNPFALPFIALLNRLFKKNIIIIFHGELEFFITPISFYKLHAIYKLFNFISFKFLLKKSNIKILLLGNSIKRNLIEIFPQVTNLIISINHPYIFQNNNSRKLELNKKLTIGTVGLLIPEKGLYELLKISNAFKKDISEDKIEIKIIGKVPAYINKENYKEITWMPNEYIPRDIFDKEIDTLDFILFLYPTNSYKLIASGALLDALSKEKPIIALKNSYFKECFEDYEVGYLCNSTEEITETIIRLINSDKQIKYEQFVNNIRLLKNKFSIEYNTDLLKQQLS